MIKRLLPLFLAVTCLAQTHTPHLGLYQPTVGQNMGTWGPLLNSNSSVLDNIFALSTCGDTSHAVSWNASTKTLGCQLINNTPSGILPVLNGGTGTANPSLVAGQNIGITGAWPNQTITATGSAGGSPAGSNGQIQYNNAGNFGAFADGSSVQVLHGGRTYSSVGLTTDVSGILPIANGGNGSASPGIVQGTGAIVTGSWPNQTISVSGGGGGGSYTTLKVMSAYASAQLALNDINVGDTMMVDGTYSLCNGTISTSNFILEGSGFQSGVLQCGTANAPVLTVSGNGVLVQNLNIKHTVSPTSGGEGLVFAVGTTSDRVVQNLIQLNYDGLVLGPSSFGVVTANYIQRNNNHGVLFKSDGISQVMQWAMSGNLVQQNLGDGYNFVLGASVTGLQITCPTFEGETAYGNAGKGWDISASAATTSGIGDCFWGASSFASFNNDDGFYLDPGPNGGRNFQIVGGFSELSGQYTGGAGYSNATQSATNIGYGVEITSSCDSTISPMVVGMTLWQNSYSGVISSCTGTEFANISAFKSGISGSSNSWQRAGVAVRASNIGVHGGYMRNSGGAQTYGVDISNSADTPDILGVRCDSTTTTCINASTSPANGFQSYVGNKRLIIGTGTPAMVCTNGDEYRRSDAGNFSTLYVCKNAAWGAIN